MGKSRAYQVIDAGRVARVLRQSTKVDSPSERVSRELVPVLKASPDDVEVVYGEVVNEFGPRPTAAQTRSVVGGYGFRARVTVKRLTREEILKDVTGMKLVGQQKNVLDAATTISRAVGTRHGKTVDMGTAVTTVYPELVDGWREGIRNSIAFLQGLERLLDQAHESASV